MTSIGRRSECLSIGLDIFLFFCGDGNRPFLLRRTLDDREQDSFGAPSGGFVPGQFLGTHCIEFMGVLSHYGSQLGESFGLPGGIPARAMDHDKAFASRIRNGPVFPCPSRRGFNTCTLLLTVLSTGKAVWLL